MTKDFDYDYDRMLAGELYSAFDIHPRNGSQAGKILADKINRTPIENREGKLT